MQGVYFHGDANDYFTRLAYTAERLRAGHAPLWNPYLSLGGTHAGDPAALTWYPPALLLFQMLPAAVAYNYTFVLHFFFAAAGMYLFARSWNQTRPSALVAAIVFGFGSFVVAHLQHLNIVIGTAWLPWIFLCIEKFFVTRRVMYIGLGALAIGLQVLGGHTQMVLYGASAWGAYSAVWLVREWRGGGIRVVWKPIAAMTTMVVLAFGLAAIYLVPFIELLNFIARSERITYEFATSFSLEPMRLLAFVYPYFFGGNPDSIERGAGSLIEMSPYVGILPLALSAFAVTRREWRVSFLFGLALVALLLALGKFTPLYEILYRLPLFGSVRAPARFLELVMFALALLAGFGLEEIKNPKTKLLHNFVLGLLMITGIGLGAFALAPRYGIQLSETFAQAARNRALFVALAFVVGAILILLIWTRGIFSARTRVVLTLAFVFLDLLYFGANFRYNWIAPFNVYDAPSKNARAMQRDDDHFNAYYWGLGETKTASLLQRGDMQEYVEASRAGLRQSLPLRFEIHSMQGYGSEPPAYAELIRRIEQSGKFDARAAQWLGKFGVQHVLSQSKLELPNLQLLEKNEGVSLWRLNRGSGRVHFALGVTSVRNPDEALRVLETSGLTELQTTLETSSIENSAPNMGLGSYLMIQDDPEHVTIDVNVDTPTYLVLNDTFYPGWYARVNGEPAPLYRANGLVRAVPVSAGVQRVEFVYDPLSVKIGAAISAVTLLIVASMIFWDWRRGAKKMVSTKSWVRV